MQTHITTFYSFKGGVGRSLLLANVGALLAQKAAPVLLWDLDLEAPGLHHIPALRPKPVPNEPMTTTTRVRRTTVRRQVAATPDASGNR